MLGKTTTLRLDADRSARLALVARVELTSQAAVVRDALDAYFATRSADPTFRTRLEHMQRADAALLDADSETP